MNQYNVLLAHLHRLVMFDRLRFVDCSAPQFHHLRKKGFGQGTRAFSVKSEKFSQNIQIINIKISTPPLPPPVSSSAPPFPSSDPPSRPDVDKIIHVSPIINAWQQYKALKAMTVQKSPPWRSSQARRLRALLLGGHCNRNNVWRNTLQLRHLLLKEQRQVRWYHRCDY